MRKLLLLTLVTFLFGGLMAQINVEMKVDMTDAENFNPATDDVYVSGSIFGWPQPGTNANLKLTPDETNPMIYTFSTVLEVAQEIQYKYFRVVNGAATWDLGEWPAEPNRKIYVIADATLNDKWGLNTAMVQVIHNCADAAATVVDLWLNDKKLSDDGLPFRHATPYLYFPAGVNINITIKEQGSTIESDTILSKNYNLEAGKRYILIASGIVSASGYEPPRPFDIHVYDIARLVANDPTNTDIIIFHGSTDAPEVSIWEVSGEQPDELVGGVSYGDYTGYLELPVANYMIQVRNAAGTEEVATYAAPLQTFQLGGFAFTAIASGFLDIAANSNGPHFGLFAALSLGGALIPLQETTFIQTIEAASMNVYPNPATNSLNIEILQDASKLEIYNVMGEKIQSFDQIISSIITVNTSRMATGVYFINLHTENGIQTVKFLKK